MYRNETYGNELCEEHADIAGPSTLGLKVFAIVILIIGIPCSMWSVFFYLKERQTSTMLQRRNLSLYLGSGVICFIQFMSGIIRVLIGGNNFSCQMIGIIYVITLGVSINIAFALLLSLFWRINYNTKLITATYAALSRDQSEPVNTFDKNPSQAYYTPQVFALSGDRRRSSYAYLSPKLKKITQNIEFMFFKVICWTPPKHLPSKIHFNHFLASEYAVNLYILSSSLLFILFLRNLILSQLPTSEDCYGCLISAKFSFVPIMYQIILPLFTIGFFWVMYLLRKIPDSLGVKQHLFLCGIAYSIDMLIGTFLVFIGRDLEVKGILHPTIIESTLRIVLLYLTIPYQVYDIRKRQNQSVDTDVTLESILKSSEGRMVFSLYLVSILSLETLLFYIEAGEWKEVFDEITPEEQNEKAQRIYDNFIGKDAILLINIPSEMNDKLENDMKNNIHKEMFCPARSEMIYLMSAHLFPGFSKSNYFKTYLNGSR